MKYQTIIGRFACTDNKKVCIIDDALTLGNDDSDMWTLFHEEDVPADLLALAKRDLRCILINEHKRKSKTPAWAHLAAHQISTWKRTHCEKEYYLYYCKDVHDKVMKILDRY